MNNHLIVMRRELDTYQKNDFAALKTRVENSEAQSMDLFKKLTEVQQKILVSNQKAKQLSLNLSQTQSFLTQALPIFTYSLISDVLQEFLCIPD